MAATNTAYVHKSIRQSGRVRRTYVGSLADPVVYALVKSERLGKAVREAEDQIADRELKVVETAYGCLKLVQASNNQMVRSLRKRWKRTQNARVRRDSMLRPTVTREMYEDLVAEAAEGDEAALTELRKLLQENPKLQNVLGDLNRHVQDHLIDLAASRVIDVRWALVQSVKEKREELLRGGDSLPEQMLVDQVLATMLDAAVCQLGFSQSHATEAVTRRWERRLTHAQSRHQAAIKSLTEVRQMLGRDTEAGEPR